MVLLLSAASSPSRPTKLQEFHQKLGVLRDTTGGPFYLSDADNNYNWPDRGIYVFFDHGTDPLVDPVSDWSITRIGTVGVSTGSTSTLWDRLRAHRGTIDSTYGDMGGNHRGSIFRKHVGRAFIERDSLSDDYPYWGIAHRNLPDDVSTTEIREQEHELEQRVSEYIRTLPFLVINIPGDAGPDADRALIEKNLIALVSHARRTNPELQKDDWLGDRSPRAEISRTQLWNIQHVSSFYSDDIIQQVTPYINQTERVVPDETDSE